MSDQQNVKSLETVLDKLRLPFHPSAVEWKPGAVKGERAMALAYADLRAYMNRLDEVCGSEWSCEYEPWGEDRVICKLTICGVTRSSTGESNKESERSEIGGTVAEAQAFKRAAAMFGLGRYLYNLPTGWADFDPATKRFTDRAKAKLTGILVNHYHRATEGVKLDDLHATGAPDGDESESDEANQTPPHQRLRGQGQSVFGKDWNAARPWLILGWTERVCRSEPRDSASQLSDDEKDLLADYIKANATQLQRIWPNQKAFIQQTPSNGKVAA